MESFLARHSYDKEILLGTFFLSHLDVSGHNRKLQDENTLSNIAEHIRILNNSGNAHLISATNGNIYFLLVCSRAKCSQKNTLFGKAQ